MILSTASILSTIALSPARAQVSPGPLAKAHADLEGATKCLQCHASGSDSMNLRCRDCHREIDFQVVRGLGLHGQEEKTECSRCHPDHAGRDFELITWKEGSPKQFDHTRTGWGLEGKHASLRCEQCHKAELQVAGVIKLLKRKDPGESWLGLERRCLSCHQDYHQSTLEENCLSCHAPEAWKPASRFDHGTTGYPLTGKHADVKCEKCHLVPGNVSLKNERGEAIPRYKPVAHQECSSCHKDVHAGQLGPKCASCHVTEGFKIVDKNRFDHSKTHFTLVGKHRSVECAKCHDPQRAWGKKPPFKTCDSCHKDVHAGKATLAGQVVDCGSCHDERAFKPSTYTVVRHRESDYPLEGKHQQVACDRCHLKNPVGVPASTLGEARILMRPAYENCRDCHRDLHGGQLVERTDGGACEACHRVQDWKPSTFTSAQHAEIDFSLEGRHAEAECAACHGPTRKDLNPLPGEEVLGKARVALTTVETLCASCHYDPHSGHFAADGPRPIEDGCRGCHGARAFTPSAVDAEVHRRFDYRLDGAHQAVPCVMCHEELKLAPAEIHLLRVEGASRALKFAAEHERCDACHTAPHGDQFERRADRGACDGCHAVDGWKPAARFDHERNAEFSLRGAHLKVPCESCHKLALDPEGRPRVIYRPVPQDCKDCHGKNVPRRGY